MRLYLLVALVLWVISYLVGENIIIPKMEGMEELAGIYWQSNPIIALLALVFLVAGLIPKKKD